MKFNELVSVLVLVSVPVAAIKYSLDKPLDVSAMNDELDTVGWIPHVLPKEPFPQWLTDLTGYTEWPGLDPPYVPLDFIDFDSVPEIEQYVRFSCPQDNSSCSVDCFNCFTPDDIITCSKLSQSFDDGPSPETTTLLDNIDFKTTFFTIGINIVKYPDVYRDMISRGHLMLSHTWSHAYLPALTNEKIVAQLEWSMWAMNATGNHIPRFWRPPYAGMDNRVRAIARQFGLSAVLGDRDSSDWMLIFLPDDISEDEIYDRLRGWLSNTSVPASGLIMEHESSKETIKVGIEIGKIVGNDQLTIDECVGDVKYIKVY